MGGGLEGVIGKDVPGAEAQVVELGQGHEVRDLGVAVLGALAEADGAHLGQRADRLLVAESATHGFDASDDGGGDGAQPRQQNSERALRRTDIGAFLHAHGGDYSFSLLAFSLLATRTCTSRANRVRAGASMRTLK